MAKLGYIPTMEHYSAVKWNKPLTHILKCITLSQSIQTPKATYYMIPFIGHSRKGNTIGTENRSVLVGAGGGGGVDYKGTQENF